MPARIHPEQEKGRFLSRIVVDNNDCWIWQGSVSKYGYGYYALRGREQSAHRASYRLFVGVIPRGKEVCHKCDVARCCNPEHLFLGTHAENMHDAASKGRMHNPNSRFTKEQKNYIRRLVHSGKSQHEVAAQFSVNQSSISRIISGRKEQISAST